ncbi:hypothetical protein B7P43_G07388 [Cryptotermes secundus]|uniref:Tc1-like transposase DDE domain-containing protein n=1 Tax=Cryptotermes secundus TaxID=105785 RepID=A0A2J7PN28_9NEOP|nr:hypothetical protein B7P43_G07388 [Cryptotermes secundus]
MEPKGSLPCSQEPHIVRVTGDETWVLFVNDETKWQSSGYRHRSDNNARSGQKCTAKHKKLHRVIQNKRLGELVSNVQVVLIHGNARPYTAARTRALLEHFSWELFDRPPYSPDLALINYHLFTYRSQRFNNSEDLMDSVKSWLSQEADFFDIGIQKLIPR